MERPDRPMMTWRKSTYSGSNASNCVEVGASAAAILVRDTKNRAAGTLSFTPAAWHRFLQVL